jgi:hypothetical protein
VSPVKYKLGFYIPEDDALNILSVYVRNENDFNKLLLHE